MTNPSVRNLVLYNCTFRKDLKRTVKLAQSIQKHNTAKIPFYVSVPEEDVALFKEHLSLFDVTVFNEKEIFEKNPKLDITKLYQIRGGLRQQVIKSEFWRLGLSENYLVLDVVLSGILMNGTSLSKTIFRTRLFMRAGMSCKQPIALVLSKSASTF
jgi:hypothetical protein